MLVAQVDPKGRRRAWMRPEAAPAAQPRLQIQRRRVAAALVRQQRRVAQIAGRQRVAQQGVQVEMGARDARLTDDGNSQPMSY
jgi:hypothetical protein